MRTKVCCCNCGSNREEELMLSAETICMTAFGFGFIRMLFWFIRMADVYVISTQSSGAVWKWRWLTWAPIPNSPYGLCGRKATLTWAPVPNSPYGLCGRKATLTWAPVPNSPYGLCGRKATLTWAPIPNSPYGLCGRKATLTWNWQAVEIEYWVPWRRRGCCIVMLFVLITIMLGFSFIQYTNTWLSHKAFFITRDIDI